MWYEVFFVQRAGAMELESDVEVPANSRIFANHPDFLRDHATRDFVCDSLRMLVLGVTSAHELDRLMELDIEVHRRGRSEPLSALHAVADALPGLGIVAAVLGVVITMQAIGGAAGNGWSFVDRETTIRREAKIPPLKPEAAPFAAPAEAADAPVQPA